jgi:hypothetical protein
VVALADGGGVPSDAGEEGSADAGLSNADAEVRDAPDGMASDAPDADADGPVDPPDPPDTGIREASSWDAPWRWNHHHDAAP